jgi:peptidyl-prolyl cis-trans isomerase SurA
MRPFFLFFFAVLFAAGPISAGTAEKIVAVVGSNVITETELKDALTLLKAQLISPVPDESLRQQVLEQMIENRILVSQARAETVQVTHDEIEEALDGSIEEIKSRFANDEEFLKELENENTTIDQLKERYRDEIEDRLLVQQLVDKHLKRNIRISDTDIRNFYESKKESIPDQPNTVRLSHILILPKPGSGAEERAENLINAILTKIEQGVDFAQLARQYSADEATASKGGDLGTIRRGELPDPELEASLFSMIPAEVRVTPSLFGYHVIQCIEKHGNTMRARHILVPVLATKADTLQAESLARSLAERARAGEDFTQLAKEYSDDTQTSEEGGELGFFPVEDLFPPFDEVVSSLEAGEVSDVVQGEFGYHVIKLEERIEGKESTFEEVKDELREILYQRQLAEAYDRWLDRLKKGIYIEKRL